MDIRKYFLTFLMLFGFVFSNTPIHASEKLETLTAPSTTLQLTGSEQAWLDEHPVIRVHNEKEWAPFNFFRNGKPQGFSIDFMNLLAEKLGFQVDYVTGPTWAEFLGLAKRKELDVMLNIARSEERKQFLLFTDQYVKFAQVLYTRQGMPTIRSVNDLYGKKFVVQKGFYFDEVLKKYPKIELVHVNTTEEAILAVVAGKADALLDVMPVVNHIMKKLLITNLKPGGDLGLDEGKPISLYIGVRKDWEIFREILNKGMSNITENEINNLRTRWLGFSDKPELSKVTLNNEEKTFLI
jgi:ABC-type amino acid transport substrate-binding protein